MPRHLQPTLLAVCSKPHAEALAGRSLTRPCSDWGVATTQCTASLSLLPNNDGLRPAVHRLALDGRFVRVQISVSTERPHWMYVYCGHVISFLHVDVTNCQHAEFRTCCFRG